LTDLIGNTPDICDEDVELVQKKVDTDLSEIVERILRQNSAIIDDNFTDQIDFATFSEIYAAIADYKSSYLSLQSIPKSPVVVADSVKRKEVEDGGKSKKMQKKI